MRVSKHGYSNALKIESALSSTQTGFQERCLLRSAEGTGTYSDALLSRTFRHLLYVFLKPFLNVQGKTGLLYSKLKNLPNAVICFGHVVFCDQVAFSRMRSVKNHTFADDIAAGDAKEHMHNWAVAWITKYYGFHRIYGEIWLNLVG